MRRACVLGLSALAALSSGCGGHGATTQLSIRVHGFGGNARTYTLRCDPPGGTVPAPEHVCSALSRQPALLAGGVGFDHSCPPGGEWLEVVGGRHGDRVSVAFPGCAWVPQQGDAKIRWLALVRYDPRAKHNYGRASSDAPLQSDADLRRIARERRRLFRRSDRLRGELKALARRRHPDSAPRVDPTTFRMLQKLTELATTQGGYLHPSRARVFVTSQANAESVFSGGDLVAGGPTVYAIVAPVGRGALRLVYEAKTLRPTEWGVGPRPDTAALGPGRPLF